MLHGKKGRWNSVAAKVLKVLLLASAVSSICEATPLGNVQSCQWNATSKWYDISFSTGTAKARVVYYRDDIFRIWVAPQGIFDIGASKECLVDSFPKVTSATLSDAGDYYKIETNECVLRINKNSCKFALYRKDNTTVVFQEQAPIDITAGETTQTLAPQAGDYFYGIGGWNGHFCHNGQASTPVKYTGTWGGLAQPYEEGTNPNPAPYYCNFKGYGAFRNTWKNGNYSFQNPVKTMHEEGRFDCFYFYGPSMKKVLEGYTAITGRIFMPPIWGLDFQVSGNLTKAGYPMGTIDQCIAAYVTHDFPVGQITPNDGSGSPFTPVQGYVSQYKAKNIHVNLWAGRFMTDTTLRIQFVRDWGIRFFKVDCEWIGAGYQYDWSGLNQTGPQGIEKYSTGRTFLQFTGGWAGQQRFGYCWTGDNACKDGDWIRWQIPTLIGGAMSALQGITTEMHSLWPVKSDKWHLRCLQYQAMLPFWFNNMYGVGYDAWTWNACPAYEALCRAIYKHRTRLVPYIYTTCYEAWKTGVPSQRPVMLEFPDDPNTWDNGTTGDSKTLHEYMLGPSFLLRPVFEDLINSDKITMYLPGNSNTRWINYWAGDVATGGQNIQAYAGGIPMSGQNLVMPTFVREGAIIPMFPPQYYSTGGVLERPREPLTLDVYPHRSQVTSFSYYEDDGNTREFKTGKCSFSLIESDATKWTASKQLVLTIGAAVGDYTGKPTARTYLASIHTGIIDKNKPLSVCINQTPLSEMASFAACSTSTTGGWFYSANDRGGILWVKTAALPTNGTYYISTGGCVGIAGDVTKRTVLDKWQVLANAQGVRIALTNMFSGRMTALIYDLQGRLVVRKPVEAINGTINVLAFGRTPLKGQYIMELEYNGKISAKRFFVHK